MIAYHFPPENVMGALRPLGLAKYLPQFGWEPIVLIPQWSYGSRDDLKKSMNIVEVSPFDIFLYLRGKSHNQIKAEVKQNPSIPAKGKNLVRDYIQHQLKTVLAFPDRNNGWTRIAMRAADKILRENDIRCIFTTSSPWTTAVIGKKLKLRHKIPWVADFRDLWSQYHRYSYCALRHLIETQYEKNTLKYADHLVMVSEERAIKWRKLHQDKKISALTLGFDEDDFRNVPIAQRKDKFVLTYAGNIKEKHFPEPLLKAIYELIRENRMDRRRVELNFWGVVPERVVEEAKNLGVTDMVHFHPLIPRGEVLKKSRESHVLVLLNWDSPDELGVHPGKLFEYLGARIPILSIGRFPTVVAKVLEQTGAGVHLTNFGKLKSYLNKAYDAFCREGSLPYQGRDEEIDLFTYRSISQKLAQILTSVSGGTE